MSAAEVIELIKKLPPVEREEVRAFLEKKGELTAGAEMRQMKLEKGMAIGDDVFRRHPELFRKLAQLPA